jgi:hypothetical protein
MYCRVKQLSTDVSEIRAASITRDAARTSETSVDNYFTRQYIPEDNSELQKIISKGSQAFINRYLRKLFKIFWLNTISNEELESRP